MVGLRRPVPSYPRAANVHGGTAAEVATDVAGFGGYALDTKVGEGPRGTVWRATHVETGRQVAVKELSPALTGDEEFMARYRPRATKLAAVGEHPNRVPVLEFLEEPGRVWIVEPWVDGRRLDMIVAAAADGGLTPEEAVALVVGLLAGLASTKGIVHGDVRPENIVVAADGTPLVTDFGIPLPLGDDAGEDVYRSAEAVRFGKLDARSDVYSAAAVLNELLGGTPELVQAEVAEAGEAVARAGEAGVAEAGAGRSRGRLGARRRGRPGARSRRGRPGARSRRGTEPQAVPVREEADRTGAAGAFR